MLRWFSSICESFLMQFEYYLANFITENRLVYLETRHFIKFGSFWHKFHFSIGIDFFFVVLVILFSKTYWLELKYDIQPSFNDFSWGDLVLIWGTVGDSSQIHYFILRRIVNRWAIFQENLEGFFWNTFIHIEYFVKTRSLIEDQLCMMSWQSFSNESIISGSNWGWIYNWIDHRWHIFQSHFVSQFYECFLENSRSVYSAFQIIVNKVVYAVSPSIYLHYLVVYEVYSQSSL